MIEPLKGEKGIVLLVYECDMQKHLRGAAKKMMI